MNLAAVDTPKTDQETATLYKRIRTDIERRILSGEWPPGHRIPFEHELTVQYNCSRMTVSKALAELAQADLIERRRRAGTYVRHPQMQSAVLKIADIRAEITALGRHYGYELLRRRKRKATIADHARLDDHRARDVLSLACSHSADGVPFAIEDRLINLDAVPDAGHVDFSGEPPGTWLIGHVPWTEAEHTISAISADTALAAGLEIAVGTPCLVIHRRTWRAGQTLTAVRLVYPGAAHQLVARFQRS
jgi:GntR family transcriptional regulator, histidine utilization repressor